MNTQNLKVNVLGESNMQSSRANILDSNRDTQKNKQEKSLRVINQFASKDVNKEKNNELLRKCKEAREQLVPKLKSLNILGKPKKYNANHNKKKGINRTNGEAEPDETELNLVKGKMYINDLWNKKLNNQVTVASKLQDLRRVMDQYKKNLKFIRQLDQSNGLQEELDRHLSELTNVAKVIENDVANSKFHSEKDIGITPKQKYQNELQNANKELIDEFMQVKGTIDKKQTNISVTSNPDYSQYNFSKVEKAALTNYRPSKLNQDFLGKTSIFGAKKKTLPDTRLKKTEPKNIFNTVRNTEPGFSLEKFSKNYNSQETFKHTDMANKRTSIIEQIEGVKPKISNLDAQKSNPFLTKNNSKNLIGVNGFQSPENTARYKPSLMSTNFESNLDQRHKSSKKNNSNYLNSIKIIDSQKPGNKSSVPFTDFQGTLQSQRERSRRMITSLIPNTSLDKNHEQNLQNAKKASFDQLNTDTHYHTQDFGITNGFGSKNMNITGFKKNKNDSIEGRKSLQGILSDKSLHRVDHDKKHYSPNFNINTNKKVHKTARDRFKSEQFEVFRSECKDKHFQTVQVRDKEYHFKDLDNSLKPMKQKHLDFQNTDYNNHSSIAKDMPSISNRRDIKRKGQDVLKNKAKQDIENVRKDFLDTKINFLGSYVKQKQNEMFQSLKFSAIPHKVEIHRDSKGFVFHKNDEEEIISENHKIRPNQLYNQSNIAKATNLVNTCLNHVNISKKDHFQPTVKQFQIDEEVNKHKKVEEPVLNNFEKSLMKSRIEYIKKNRKKNNYMDYGNLETEPSDINNTDKRYVSLENLSVISPMSIQKMQTTIDLCENSPEKSKKNIDSSQKLEPKKKEIIDLFNGFKNVGYISVDQKKLDKHMQRQRRSYCQKFKKQLAKQNKS